ncbi:hypothetical protein [Glaesserella parasuis]|uniref:Uncharacterized protein n=1 Tax=Glaesserella parasuis HPS9 TaxID=1450513 RepID=A0A837AE91_GLAPU|nr:hypothetical protein [Glaesserella parasuis]KDD81258.1 hypothetical protein HPS41_00640 [Glaesserella parasuis ST4-1]AIK16866.1 hypothetical protein JL26_03040 [Glaesserella parasuis]KDB44300.1 hypothetical protein HPS9_11160 [Glaesserella parasuis HPS9]MDG6247085.1 hypothetical protein [Glaesserella parasuis]MDG6277026.1 hypothetical protein [Glaesserella parasuis]
MSTLLSSFFLSGCLSPELPKCDDKEVKSLLGQIFNDSFKKMYGDYIRFIDSKNASEKGFNKEKKIRVCSADIIVSYGSEARIIYNIQWENEKKGIYQVKIVNMEE